MGHTRIRVCARLNVVALATRPEFEAREFFELELGGLARQHRREVTI
jgi:hypothetical protein